jgi:hypothetical protein
VLSSAATCEWSLLSSSCIELAAPEPPECTAASSCAEGLGGPFHIDHDVVVAYDGCAELVGFETCQLDGKVAKPERRTLVVRNLDPQPSKERAFCGQVSDPTPDAASTAAMKGPLAWVSAAWRRSTTTA